MKVTIWIVRALFVVLFVVVSQNLGRILFAAPDVQLLRTVYDLYSILVGLVVGGAIVALDVIYQKKSVAVVVALCLAVIIGTLLEILVAHILGLAVSASKMESGLVSWLELAILIFFCYIATTIILQTREDFRLVIPYVKFSPEGSEPLCFVLDTSVIIDGRIADIAETGIVDNTLIVPRFVLNELQAIADSADRLKRNRGRRGLDVLKKLQECPRARVEIRDVLTESDEPVDTKLIRMSKAIRARVVTNDFNLNKIAQLQDVEVININDLAQALRPVVLPGEEMEVKVIRPGEEIGQGVGYLDDGTMVVVEGGREFIGQKVGITVNNVYQTSAGRMIFGKAASTKNGTPPKK